MPEFFSTATVGIFVASALASLGATALLLPVLRRRAILDHPNDRASHTVPTPRGGGIAVVTVLLLAWVGIEAWQTDGPAVFIPVVVAGGLALISWIDDLRDLSPVIRLAAHIGAVAVGISALPDDMLMLQGLVDQPLDRVITALAWIWFINLFNFMDGIDGIAGVETASIGLGIFAMSAIGTIAPAWGLLGLACVGTAVGFLIFNWHPAKIFLGDVGSVPLGFLLGWLLISLAGQGLWAPAAILPLYYLADATITLGRRLARGEKIWHAHKMHFYQKAHQAGYSHAGVVKRIIVVNVALIVCAVVAAKGDIAVGLGGGGVVVVFLLWHFATSAEKAAP